MGDMIAHALAKMVVRVIDLPMEFFLIRFWIWMGAFELFDLPRPSRTPDPGNCGFHFGNSALTDAHIGRLRDGR